MGNTITMKGFGPQYGNMLEYLKMERLNEMITNLDGIYAMSITIIISFFILVLWIIFGLYEC